MLREALSAYLTPRVCREFDEQHYVVLPTDVVPTDISEKFLRDVVYCFDHVAKIPNEVEFLLPQGPVKLTKPNVYECDMHNDEYRSQLPMFAQLFESELGPLSQLFSKRMTSLSDLVAMTSSTDAKQHTTVKLQMNCGGSFPWHYDNPGVPNKRRLTMAVYLTPDWSAESCGGRLLLQPFLQPVVCVEPRLCTVALFRSDTMLHAVEPVVPSTAGGSARPRYCFTIWFDGTDTNNDCDVQLKAKHLQLEAIPLLRTTPLQRVLSRAVYDEEYRERLLLCFGGPATRDTKISLALHEAHIKPLLANPAVAAFVEELRAIKSSLLDNQRLTC